MKRAELQIGKAYYMSTSADWTSHRFASWKHKTPAQVALAIKNDSLVRVKETQLLTDYNKYYHSRDVLVVRASGREEWVSLNHIRGEFGECVRMICKRQLVSEGHERARKHERHLINKKQREIIKPARKEFKDLLQKVTGEYISDYTRIESISYEAVVKLIEALKKVEA